MNDVPLRPALQGKKAFILGIANEEPIACGGAKAFRPVGADLAVTWLNEKARRFV
jgi:enoyl-[acyl-carrier protein] reductase I